MKKMLLFLLLPLAAFASDEARVEATRNLAHAHSIGDQALMGNALASLQQQACEGDAQAAALLGTKYFSGQEEFQSDPARAELYLTFAAEQGVPGAAPLLVLNYLKGASSAASIQSAEIWLGVGRYVDGPDSPQVMAAENALELIKASNAGIAYSATETATASALTIHRLRNHLNGQVPPPCAAH